MTAATFIERRAVWILLALTVLFYWRYAFFGERFTYLDTPDGANQVLPWLQVQARGWHEGVFPMWDPHHWGGQSLFGQMQPGAAFPLNWPLFWAPLADGLIQLKYVHWHRVAMHLLTALFMFGLARELGRSRTAALFAGLAWTSVGYVATTGWPQILHGAVWAPLIFLCFHRMARTLDWRWAVFCGAAAGASILSGHPRVPLFMWMALTGAFVWWGRSRAIKAGLLYGIAGLSAFLVGALQILPAWEFGRDSVRWVGLESGPIGFEDRIPYFVDEGLRLNPVHILGTVIAKVPFPGDPFVGWTVVALALIAIGAKGRDMSWPYAVLALGALLFTFGPQTLFHGWIYALVPFAEKARGAEHAIVLFHFAMVVLAAQGFDFLINTRPLIAPVQRALVFFAAVAGAITLAELTLGRFDSGPRVYHGELVMFAGLSAALLAVALTRRNPVVMIMLMLLEAGSAQWLMIREQGDPLRESYIAKLDQPAGALEFLKIQPRPFRFEIVPDGGGTNRAAWHGLEASDGYLTALNGSVHQLMDSEGWERGRLLLNTVFTVARERTRSAQSEVFSGADGWRVFRNPDVRPRAWLDCGDSSDVQVEQGLQSILVKARSECSGNLVVSSVYAPGWVAAGYEVQPYRGALLSVVVSPGEHEVRFEYRPSSVIWGAGLTALGLALCLLLGVRAAIATPRHRRGAQGLRQPPQLKNM